jgi:hypothetical protein
MSDQKNAAEVGDFIAMAMSVGGTPDAQFENTIEVPHDEHTHVLAVSILRYGATVIDQTTMIDGQGLVDRSANTRQYVDVATASECFDTMSEQANDLVKLTSAATAALDEDAEVAMAYAAMTTGYIPSAAV